MRSCGIHVDDDPLRPAVSRHDRPDPASDGDGWPASAALGVATPFLLIGKGAVECLSLIHI